MTELGDFLNSLNKTKVNLIDVSDDPTTTEKSYPGYIVNRCLSAHRDAVLLVNELNTRGLASYGLNNRAQYEFLLYALPKANRYAKLKKYATEEKVKLLMLLNNWSIIKAREVVDFVSDAEYEKMKASQTKGGTTIPRK